MTEFNYDEAIQMLIDNLGEEKAQVLIDEFKSLIKKAIENAWSALKDKDYEAFGHHCHSIKSNVSMLGEKELEALCAQIDEITYYKNFEKISDIQPRFMELSQNIYKKL